MQTTSCLVQTLRKPIHPARPPPSPITTTPRHATPRHTTTSTLSQVQQGLLGAVWVQPNATAMPPAYTSMTAYTLVLTHPVLCTCNPTTDPFRIIDMQQLRTGTGDLSTLNAEVRDPMRGGGGFERG
jgi:hypothetical protein